MKARQSMNAEIMKPMEWILTYTPLTIFDKGFIYYI